MPCGTCTWTSPLEVWAVTELTVVSTALMSPEVTLTLSGAAMSIALMSPDVDCTSTGFLAFSTRMSPEVAFSFTVPAGSITLRSPEVRVRSVSPASVSEMSPDLSSPPTFTPAGSNDLVRHRAVVAARGVDDQLAAVEAVGLAGIAGAAPDDPLDAGLGDGGRADLDVAAATVDPDLSDLGFLGVVVGHPGPEHPGAPRQGGRRRGDEDENSGAPGECRGHGDDAMARVGPGTIGPVTERPPRRP